MTVWKSVGRSRYKGDTNGVEQFLQEHAASRILDLIEIVARQPGCRRMTVNEGRRTRPRQDDLWRRWKNGTGYLAAVPYTSRHDEERHGNAADLGGPDGEALNLAERAAISRFGPAIGVHFTGLTFRPVEPWHVEADETPYTRRYGSTAPAGSTATPIESEEDDIAISPEELKVMVAEAVGTYARGGYIIQSPSRTALVGPGHAGSLNASEFARLRQRYHLVSLSELEFDLEVAGNKFERPIGPPKA